MIPTGRLEELLEAGRRGYGDDGWEDDINVEMSDFQVEKWLTWGELRALIAAAQQVETLTQEVSRLNGQLGRVKYVLEDQIADGASFDPKIDRYGLALSRSIKALTAALQEPNT